MSEKKDREIPFLYQNIYNTLKKEILDKKYEKGGDLPPERVLKERFNTSHLTIRKALTKLVADGLIERFSGKGTVVVYPRPKTKITRIHCIIPGLDPETTVFLETLEQELQKLDLELILLMHRESGTLAGTMVQKAADDELSLTLLVPPLYSAHPAMLSPVEKTVFINSFLDRQDVCRISSDDFQGSSDAARYLLDLGYRNFAHISSNLTTAGEYRKAGFLQGLHQAGLEKDAVFCVHGGTTAEGGAHACRTILQRVTDIPALFCANETAAIGAMGELKKAGIIPGEHCSIIGFGDSVLSETESLTTVSRDWERISKYVTLFLQEFMSEGTLPGIHVPVPTKIVLRNSCKSVCTH